MGEDSAAAATIHDASVALRALAARLSTHGLGGRWEGPSRRVCEVQVQALEDALRAHARQLETLAPSRSLVDW